MHPLMGLMPLGSVMVLGVLLSESRMVRVWGTVGLALTAVAMAAGIATGGCSGERGVPADHADAGLLVFEPVALV